MLVLAGLAACHGDDGHHRRLAITSGPSLGEPGPGVYFARWFDLATNLPSSLVLTVDGPDGIRDIAFPGLATEHHVPLLQLRPETTYLVTARVTDAEDSVEAEIEVATGPIPAAFPALTVVRSEPDRMEPGVTLLTANGEVEWLAAVDAEGVLVYLMEVVVGTYSVVPNVDGDFAMVAAFTVEVRSPMGEVRKRFTATPSEPEDVAVVYPDFHHELVPQPDGSFFSLSYRHEEVPEYPTGYDPPFTFAPATIRNDLVVHVGPDGTTLDEFAMLDLLDVHRIGFDSLKVEPSGALDWVHTNALQYDTDTDEITVSLRHQDAVVRFSRATGALKWIFAAPYAWSPELAPYVLTATEPFVWPTHQHGIEVTDDGRLRMFDNGNDGRDTPYYDSGEDVQFSRIFEATIDEAARTVTPAAAYSQTTAGPLYASALGNADLLPITGNRLGTWGNIGRVAEFADDGAVVFELVVGPPDADVDRATRLPSLYPPDVIVTAR